MKKLGITFISLFVGGLIYVLWRSETLVMFTWFDYLGIAKPIGMIRNTAAGYSSLLPSWVLYSLPDALWYFSGLIIFDVIWGQELTISKILWLSSIFITAISMEAGQALKLFPGTFDINDVLLMFLASLLALKIISASNKESIVNA